MDNLTENLKSLILKDKELYTRIKNYKEKHETEIPYGTSGFRFNWEL